MSTNSNDIIEALAATLTARREADPESSYVASLYAAGLNKILEKIGEEATEVVIAAKDVGGESDNSGLVGEVADLWFHTMVMLVHLDVAPGEVLETLQSRFGVSGHEEKSSRQG